MSTAILIFTKTNSGGTDNVWFYDCDADGWSLDDKRTPLLSEEKLGAVPTAALSADEHAKNVKLIDKQKRKPIYTDFEDQMGGESEVGLPGFDAPDSFERFRAKARAFLKEHEDNITIRKLRMNVALTRSDLEELERMLTMSGAGGAGDVQKAKEESHGLGLFVRSPVGLDREAAKQAFAGFLVGRTLDANQIEFMNLIVDHLTEHGVIGAALLYESPFIDVTPRGPDGLFTAAELDELLAILDQVRETAVAA